MASRIQTNAAEEDPDEEVVLEVRDANVSFDMSRGESRVLRDVDLEVRRGETLGIVGESGSGKSMLASAMLDAVVDPGQLSGEVIFHPDEGDPVDVLSLSEREQTELRWNEISFVIQAAQSAFNPTMTVGAHFEETLRAHDRDVTEGMATATELLEDLYLPADQVLRSHPHELSGGQKQRRALLKAVPNVSDEEIAVAGISGSGPDPVNVPEGCSYHPRCPLADEQCRREDPEFRSAGDDHEVTCFHWEDAADEIPLDTGGNDD